MLGDRRLRHYLPYLETKISVSGRYKTIVVKAIGSFMFYLYFSIAIVLTKALFCIHLKSNYCIEKILKSINILISVFLLK